MSARGRKLGQKESLLRGKETMQERQRMRQGSSKEKKKTWTGRLTKLRSMVSS